MPRSSAMYAGFAAAQRHLIQLNGGSSSAPVAFAAGAVSGIPEAMVATPFQVCSSFTVANASSLRSRRLLSSAGRNEQDHDAHGSSAAATVKSSLAPSTVLPRPPRLLAVNAAAH
jgi:hypothetical protein